MVTYTQFYDLPAYQFCRKFRIKVSDTIREYVPKKELFLLAAQLLDSSRSVTLNIEEGFGRYHHGENIQFCRISRKSLMESMDHLIVSREEKYVNDEILSNLNKDYKEYLLQLNMYIKYIKIAKKECKGKGR